MRRYELFGLVRMSSDPPWRGCLLRHVEPSSINHQRRTNSPGRTSQTHTALINCAELFVGFGLKADALKAGAEMGHQVLSIVRIQSQLKLAMGPVHVPSGG